MLVVGRRDTEGEKYREERYKEKRDGFMIYKRKRGEVEYGDIKEMREKTED